jgi:cytochrome d ubiquinol oxidase subunit II
MSLHNVWFVVIAIFWTGFFVLEGFDFGVGILHTIVGKTDAERQAAISTIGPFWDGNEVFLVVAGAATFAAFPSWYATWFSALYLALVLILVALIARGVSLEYHHRVTEPKWRRFWTWALTLGSALVPLLIGVGLGDLVHGLPINKSQDYTGTFWNLLTGYGLWVGVTLLVLSVLHGAAFLVLKTTGDVKARARRVARRVAGLAVLVVAVFVVWTQALGHGVFPGPLQITAFLAVVAAAWSIGGDHEGWTFAATAVAMGLTVSSIFVHLFPNVMVSSTNAKFNLTVSNAASGSYALQVITVVAIVFFPLVLAYTAWSYHVFRGRISAPPSSSGPAATSETAAAASKSSDEGGSAR